MNLNHVLPIAICSLALTTTIAFASGTQNTPSALPKNNQQASALASAPMPISGNTLYVAEDGNDENNGLMQGKAFKTIEKALSVAQDHTLIIVGPGTFSVSAELVIDKAIEIRGAGMTETTITTPQTGNGAGHRTISMNNAGGCST